MKFARILHRSLVIAVIVLLIYIVWVMPKPEPVKLTAPTNYSVGSSVQHVEPYP